MSDDHISILASAIAETTRKTTTALEEMSRLSGECSGRDGINGMAPELAMIVISQQAVIQLLLDQSQILMGILREVRSQKN